jgi:integrase
MLREHIGTRTSGYLFESSKGTPLARSNVLRRSLHKILQKMGREKCGFHAFRRFRITHLRKQRVMEVLLRIWVGHSTEGITDKYTVETLKRDVAYRKATAEQLALVSTHLWNTNCQLHELHEKCTHLNWLQQLERIGRGERI